MPATNEAQSHFHSLDQITGYDFIGEAFEIDASDSDESLRYFACPVVYAGVPYVLIAHVITNDMRTFSHVNENDLNKMVSALRSVQV